MALIMQAEEITEYLDEVFPQIKGQFAIDTLREDRLITRLLVGEHHLRPGGTVSGPSIFGLADVSVYVAILARIGRKALAVTTSSSIDFMRKPAAGKDLLGECRLLKLGRVLAVGDVLVYSEGSDQPVARANMTYSIPPER